MEAVFATFRYFDVFATPVAQLNMRGQPTLRTVFGGFVSIVLAVLIIWFTWIRIDKMLSLDEPFLYQVD